ncbi:MAG TPA: RCC1 domain-containing protein, partial [Gemmatimonadales bacterium]|nr:RCC1 domain-containing protein [Gemmatimonadales bacterium]
MTIEAVGWPTDLHVTQVDTIEVRVRLFNSSQQITGLRLRWLSSNDNLLRVVPLQPNTGEGLKDTLLAQLRAEVTGQSGGFDTVRVLVERGGGFEPAAAAFPIRVTQKWIAVSAGLTHTCGVTVDKMAYCWG